MMMNNRQKRLIACLLCALLLVSSLSMTVGAVVEAIAVQDVTLTRFDWGVLDPAYGKDALARNEQGERVSEGFSMSYGELADALGCADGSARVYVTDASGRGQGNADAAVNGDGGITFRKSGTAGESVFYYVLKSDNRMYGPAAVRVYTYGVADSVFVLDYGLPVSLPMSQIMQGDLLTLTPKTTLSITMVDEVASSSDLKEGQYGTFTADGTNVIYTARDFMNGADSMEIKVCIAQSGKAFRENVTGVTMTKTLKVVPANVVYYEDDFEGLNYINTFAEDDIGNVWAVYEGENKGFEQSADRDMNYGFDPNYEFTKSFPSVGESYLAFVGLDGTGIEELDDLFAEEVARKINLACYGVEDEPYELYGDASNDVIHAMSVRVPTGTPILTFDFRGTGFELLSRTTYWAYGVLTVKVEQQQDDGSWRVVRALPVITECTNNDLYQVPVIAMRDLPCGDYRVTVITSNVQEEDRMIYVDGIRVYEPMGDEGKAYYKADEAGAEFYEIKEEIKNANVVFGEINIVPEQGDAFRWAFGTTTIENANEYEGTLTNTLYPVFDEAGNQLVYDKNEYMNCGPNNEIYLSTLDGCDLSFIALYLVKDETVADEDRSIQVGAHYKFTWDSEGYSDGIATMVYGGRSTHVASGEYSVDVCSGTEQYYSLDTDVLIEVDGKALLLIGIENWDGDVLALTNLKLHGYTLATNTDDELEVIQDLYDVNASILMRETVKLYSHYSHARVYGQLHRNEKK